MRGRSRQGQSRRRGLVAAARRQHPSQGPWVSAPPRRSGNVGGHRARRRKWHRPLLQSRGPANGRRGLARKARGRGHEQRASRRGPRMEAQSLLQRVRAANKWVLFTLRPACEIADEFRHRRLPSAAGRPVRRPEAALLRRLVPHLSTALAFRQRLAAVESHQNNLAHILDRIDAGAILTDSSGRPSFVNRRGSEILGEADGLMLTRAGLAAATPEATRHLRAAVAAVAGPNLQDAAPIERGGEARLRLVGCSGRLLLLTLLPISRLRAPFPGERAPASRSS